MKFTSWLRSYRQLMAAEGKKVSFLLRCRPCGAIYALVDVSTSMCILAALNGLSEYYIKKGGGREGEKEHGIRRGKYWVI